MPLVDSDIGIDALRSVPQAVARLDAEEQSGALSLSTASCLEVLVGCRSKREERFLRRFGAVPLDAAVCARAVELVRRYHLSHGLLLADALIAATALVHDIPLLTKNRRDSRFIAGLRLLDYP